MIYEAVEELLHTEPTAIAKIPKKTYSKASTSKTHSTKSPIITCLTNDILSLLSRFMIQTDPCDLSFQSFKQCWAQPDRHFSYFHHIFDPAKVDYTRLLQTAFQISMQQFFIVPVEVLNVPHLQNLGTSCVFHKN
jgi:hypothetical protein